MKLLLPNATKESQGNQLSLDLLRIEEVKKLLKDLNTQRAKAESGFQTMLAGQLARWANEEQDHSELVKKMVLEIDGLEAKKLNALIPFDILKEQTDNRFKEAETFLATLREREEKAEELIENFENKLDEFGEREQNLKKKESIASFIQKGIDLQKESIKAQSEKLTQALTDFEVRMRTGLEELNKRKTEVIFMEQSFSSKENSIKRTEKSLSEWAIRLQDERQVLDAAWKELKGKTNIPIEKK